MDPLTGKSISLLKLSSAEEDIVWVYENFSYSCELPACALFCCLCTQLLQGLRPVRQAEPAVNSLPGQRAQATRPCVLHEADIVRTLSTTRKTLNQTLHPSSWLRVGQQRLHNSSCTVVC